MEQAWEGERNRIGAEEGNGNFAWEGKPGIQKMGAQERDVGHGKKSEEKHPAEMEMGAQDPAKNEESKRSGQEESQDATGIGSEFLLFYRKRWGCLGRGFEKKKKTTADSENLFS